MFQTTIQLTAWNSFLIVNHLNRLNHLTRAQFISRNERSASDLEGLQIWISIAGMWAWNCVNQAHIPVQSVWSVESAFLIDIKTCSNQNNHCWFRQLYIGKLCGFFSASAGLPLDANKIWQTASQTYRWRGMCMAVAWWEDLTSSRRQPISRNRNKSITAKQINKRMCARLGFSLFVIMKEFDWIYQVASF